MTLSHNKQIVIGAVVLVVLAGLAYRQVKKDQQLGAMHSSSADMPTLASVDDVDKLQITNGSKGEIVLEKQGDRWKMTKPIAVGVRQDHVRHLLDNVKDIKIKEMITLQADDALKNQYELDEGHAVHLIAWKGGEKKIDCSFGKFGGRGELMMVADRPEIFAASGYSSYHYTREAKNWRENEIFKFDDSAVSHWSIDRKGASFSFTKGDKWAGTFQGKPITRLDEEKIKDALRVFKGLTADDFADNQLPEEVGLTQPEAIINFELKDGAGKYVLKVGKVSSGSSHYAIREGDQTVFIIGSLASGWAMADVAKFQVPADAGASKSDPSTEEKGEDHHH
ncbi:DUF4340 domain-containing protein [Pajaroellobacter abortibovis]|uniref:DUF4340 domain-containing protein n=1 Tax=Pajaroellobacter abortibovis TaxID=1882918 RepID=A0A1L6MYW4_9BACT|nr:DUF4340 domain-containing protein [Pajaroellobacter abortibovis]APS00712.1 hypothetical protein BCY86_08495 [Pajaroellobacter abortibovis]